MTFNLAFLESHVSDRILTETPHGQTSSALSTRDRAQALSEIMVPNPLGH